MRTVLLVLLLSGIATADTPKPPAPDLEFTWEEGEMSRDMSIWETRITVTGTKLHYARKYSGRYSGMPGMEPVAVDATVKDPKKVAAALAALDKIKVKPAKKRTQPEIMQLREGCVTRGKVTRCARGEGPAADPPDLKAMVAIREALLDGVKLPDAL